MKILWVKAGGLVPPDTGGKIRSYSILRELALHHRVTFFSFYGAHASDAHPDLESIFDRVVCIPLQLPAARGWGEFLNYSARSLSPEPYSIGKYCRQRVRAELRKLAEREAYDVILCDFIFAAGAIPWDLACPKVLFTHNVEALIWRRHYEVTSNLLWKWLCWLEWKKMQRAEQHYLGLADHVLTVSENDRGTFARFLGSRKLSTIPTGVDTEYFQPTSGPEMPNSIVFTGSMDWLPNQDAIFYFVEEILPFIRQQVPDVSLWVIGRKPSRSLEELAAKRNNIHITGWVEDIRPYLARGAVSIVPLRIGGGTRIKIFEAMAMGKPVVSTSVGAEGLPVRDGEHILIADEPWHFAECVISLFANTGERLRLGMTSRKLVEENYSWRKVASEFGDILAQIVDKQSLAVLNASA